MTACMSFQLTCADKPYSNPGICWVSMQGHINMTKGLAAAVMQNM